MHLTYLSVVYSFFLLVTLTKQDESVINFKPSRLNLVVGKPQTITVRLVKSNITLPATVDFLYDDKLDNTHLYIDTISNITFTTNEQSQDIVINGRREGHLVLSAQSFQVNISSIVDFILIDIARSNILTIFIQIVGWIYFAAWSISFYPQIILNFQRRSVVGFNFDFLSLNIIGHSCYAVFNLSLYTSVLVQQEYHLLHPHGVLPVLLNDVIFSCHAVFACVVIICQCLFFERGKQRVSHVARLIAVGFIVFLLISTIISFSGHLSRLTLLYFFSYVKLAITIIKYLPQAWMNYKRKSTEGWSIGNILLDFTGGVLSLFQMFLLATNYNDWTSIFGSPTKFGLGLFSILFALFFMTQHFILYRTHGGSTTRINGEVNENSPILSRKS